MSLFSGRALAQAGDDADDDAETAPSSGAAASAETKAEAGDADKRAANPEAKPTNVAEGPDAPRAAAAPNAEGAEEAGILEAATKGWNVEVHGYFRAPMAIGLSSRPGPDNLNGPSSTQVSYGQNRTVDWSYYSFGYTRLQEQDWAEVLVHAKRKHVDAAVGWMGYWFSGVGYRNPDAAWAPAIAYVALDTDFHVGALKPNIALTMGAFWPKFGYFEKYDTYTLGRFRQMGEQLNLTIPVNTDLSVGLTHGFGTNRDGSWNSTVGGNPLYSTTTAVDLVTYANAQVKYKQLLDAGLHFNTMWTADPQITQQAAADSGKAFSDAKEAHLSVLGAEVNVRAPYVGHVWLSPSLISVKNGWALANGGTEVMHSLGGAGIAANYLAWTNTPSSSTGSGTLTNIGFLYENSLASLKGKPAGTVPDLSLSVFGLLTNTKMTLPGTSTLTQSSVNQFKYGADLTLQATSWLGLMLRYDFVNYFTAQPGYVFSAITPRLVVSSHFLSSERIYLQYSRYTYGDKMVLNGVWPWGAPLISGANVAQAGSYSGQRPDSNVIKLQAEVAF